MALLESTLVAYGRRTVFDAVGSKADLELWVALNDAIDMLAQDHRWEWFLRRGHMSTVAPYSTGTITLTAASATVTGSGTTFPATAAGRRILVSGQILDVLSYTSGTSITLTTTWGGATTAGLSYIMFRDEYALPDTLYEFKRILPGQAWGWGGLPVPIEELWEAQNAATTTQKYADLFALSNGNLVVYPYPNAAATFAYSYYAKPTAVTGAGSANLDWPTAHLNLLHRAYDVHLALRFGKTVVGDYNACYAIYQAMLAASKVKGQGVSELPGMMDMYGSRQTPDWKRRV